MSLLVLAALAGASSGFLPHGYCYLWNRPLLLTHLTSDLLIGLSYVTISASLALLVHRLRRDIPFRVIFVAFGLFIVACGMTHFMEVWTLWAPHYWLAGGVKVVTAVASVTTAVAMPFMVPRVQTTVREARLSHDRELAAERAAALEESNEILQQQAIELEQQREEAESLAEELEQANAELRAALGEAEDARAAAQSADRAKSDFLATMSHELRTPLNAIVGYQSLMVEGIVGPLTPGQEAYLDRIKQSAGHLLGLINEVLTLARVEAGKEELRLELGSVGRIVDEAVAMVEPQAAAKGLTLAVSAPSESVLLETDFGKVRQILANLLANAVKFTERGGITLAVEAAEHDRVAFAVRDTGIGISGEHVGQVFNPFWQVEQTTTRRAGGTGLGLSVSKRLADVLGGEIHVRSEPGRGSEFTLLVPARHSAAVGQLVT